MSVESNYKYKLTIGIVTMNRANQLKEAIESCLTCDLPKNTQFVIIDNASSDHTESVVHKVLKQSGYDYVYHRSNVNLGAGAGRTLYYEKAEGEYVYGMDDDAVIDISKNKDFFIKAINILDRNPQIASLATQIYDTAWNRNRIDIKGCEVLPGIYYCKMFCGGSHFLRCSFFEESPYLSNKYGYEELPPSLMVFDRGMVNAFCPNLYVTHKPAVNKWDFNNEKNIEYLYIECAVPYAIKKNMYPRIFSPLVWLSYKIRCKKYIPKKCIDNDTIKNIILQTCEDLRLSRKIKHITVIKMYFKFGLSIF